MDNAVRVILFFQLNESEDVYNQLSSLPFSKAGITSMTSSVITITLLDNHRKFAENSQQAGCFWSLCYILVRVWCDSITVEMSGIICDQFQTAHDRQTDVSFSSTTWASGMGCV